MMNKLKQFKLKKNVKVAILSVLIIINVIWLIHSFIGQTTNSVLLSLCMGGLLSFMLIMMFKRATNKDGK